MFISLWTVPIILRALGQSDYGLYTLVAGVVAMLAFLNDSMTVVVQRFMSVTMGENNIKKLNNVFNASIRIHLFLGLIIIILFELCSLFLFSNFLNISPDRIYAAKIIFQFMIVTTFFTVIAVPFDAVLNAYENMVTFSVVSICESIGRLLLAFFIIYTTKDKLIVYGLGMAIIACLGILVRYIIVKFKYKILQVNLFSKVPSDLYREMLAYAGWNTLGSIAMLGKNQGIAIIFNLFEGTVINASYGIANQINALLSSFASNIQKAISPQLMKSEGANNHNTMFLLSFSLVKISTIIYSLMAIPLVVEMHYVLKIWLGDNVPLYAVSFCQLTILVQLFFQLSSGVALTIDAVGKIKIYRIVLSSVLILNLPLAYIALRLGFQPQAVFISMFIIEGGCLFVRLFFAKQNVSFPVINYLKQCLVPLMVCICISFFACYFISIVFQPCFLRFIINILISTIILACISYKIVLSNKEQIIFGSFITRLVYKFKK